MKPCVNLNHSFFLRLNFLLCVRRRAAGQRGHTRDDAGLQHGQSSLSEVAEEPTPAAAGGRTHRVV